MLKGSSHRASQLTIVPVAFLVHNAEEALTIPAVLPQAEARLADGFGHAFRLPSANQYYVLLLVLTLAAFAVWLLAYWKDSLCYALVILQATLAVNVVNHIGSAILLRGYAPGLLTALTVQIPATAVVFSRLRRAAWLTRRQWLLLPVASIILHGPIMFGGLWLVGRWS